ncbi:hypothetical protein COC42_02815 [Sphingomonas spermidinifaciens]|uniref:Benenodin family lasso peptide n=2 Tax=Sphingomonadaceae TaxID=41297 RepID=A0A2A4B6S8_9SPHN|nr:hypothetical protein COC42_02815 [Sphingomonas spermidinifaciens]
MTGAGVRPGVGVVPRIRSGRNGVMTYEDDVIELGVASEETLGGEGQMPDFVREIPQTGLSDD